MTVPGRNDELADPIRYALGIGGCTWTPPPCPPLKRGLERSLRSFAVMTVKGFVILNEVKDLKV